VLAYLAYRFVENPLRKHSKLVLSSRNSLLLGLAFSVGAAGLAWSASQFAPGRISTSPIVDVTHAQAVNISNAQQVTDAISRLAPAPLDTDESAISHKQLDDAAGGLPPKETSHCHAQDLKGNLPQNCYFGNSTQGSVIALVGSSHAYQFYSPMLAVADAAKHRLLLETRSGCAILPGLNFIPEEVGSGSPQSCVTWQRKVITNLVQTKPEVIVIVTGRSRPVDPLTGKEASTSRKRMLISKALAELVKELEPTKSKLVFIRETPMQTYDPVICLSAHTVSACRQPLSTALLPRKMSLPSSTSRQVVTMDLSLAICNVKICPAVRHGMIVWRDRHHITDEYAKALSPLFRELFRPIVTTATR